MSLSLLGIAVSLALLMVLVFKRVGIIPATIIACSVLALMSGLPLLTALQDNYLTAMASFISSNFLIFAASALFGKLMEDSGCAAAFAKLIGKACGEKYAIYGVMIATSLLAYGGVSVFVIVFTVLPIFLAVFKQSNLPRRLLPAAIMSSSCTYAATMLPGCAQLNNLIPTQYLPTTPMAAPLVGIVCTIATMFMLFFYFEYEIRKSRKNNEGFTTTADISASMDKLANAKAVNPWLAMTPMILLLVLMNLCKLDPFIAMLAGCLLAVAIGWKNIENKLGTINQGIGGVTGAVINTAAAVGFGGVIKATSGFQTLLDWIAGFGGNPLISLSFATTMVSGATGSGGGGTGVAMQIFAERYLAMGIQPEILHRVVAISSLGLSCLPHNGLVITLLSITGFTHKEAYMPIFWSTLVTSIICMVIAVTMGVTLYPVIPM